MLCCICFCFLFFFFNDTATTEIYTLSLHDALPISVGHRSHLVRTAGLPGDRLHELHREPPRVGRLGRTLRPASFGSQRPTPRDRGGRARRGTSRSTRPARPADLQVLLACWAGACPTRPRPAPP